MMRHITLLLASLLLVQRSLAADEAAPQWLPVQGKVFVPEGSSLADVEVELRLEGGRQLLGFPAAQDGSFFFPEVPVGVHTLTVNARGLAFPILSLDVGAARKGRVEAAAADMPGNPAVPHPLLLRPYARVEYFEKREGVSLLAFLKTPYGMMAAFMLFSMFILPKLKVDPEEYQEMVEERNKLGAAITGRSPEKRRD